MHFPPLRMALNHVELLLVALSSNQEKAFCRSCISPRDNGSHHLLAYGWDAGCNQRMQLLLAERLSLRHTPPVLCFLMELDFARHVSTTRCSWRGWSWLGAKHHMRPIWGRSGFGILQPLTLSSTALFLFWFAHG